MHQRVVYMNGRFVLERQARISLYDSALATGEVVVEVTRTFKQKLFRLRDHLHRLYTGLQEMHIDPELTVAQMETMTQETLHRNISSTPSEIDWQIIQDIMLVAYGENKGLALVHALYDPISVNVPASALCTVGDRVTMYIDHAAASVLEEYRKQPKTVAQGELVIAFPAVSA